MALAGIGVDITEIDRMERVLQRTPNFAWRVFTDEEREYCERTHRPAEHYAARFAAREAVLKALGVGFNGIGPRDVWVSRSETGAPVVHLEGRAAEVAAEQGVLEIALSLSTTHDLAIANAVAVTNEVKPQPEEKTDPKEELMRSFKAARSILDELELVQDAELEKTQPPTEPQTQQDTEE